MLRCLKSGSTRRIDSIWLIKNDPVLWSGVRKTVRYRSQESLHSCGGHCKGCVRPGKQSAAEGADESCYLNERKCPSREKTGSGIFVFAIEKFTYFHPCFGNSWITIGNWRSYEIKIYFETGRSLFQRQ